MDANHLAQVISNATAPAFLLGAVMGLVSILSLRMTALIERIRSLNEITKDDTARAHLRSDVRRLKRRERLLSNAIQLALLSGISTTLLVVLTFASAFVGRRHEYLAALLFIVAVGVLGASLFRLVQEVRIALNDLEHYR